MSARAFSLIFLESSVQKVNDSGAKRRMLAGATPLLRLERNFTRNPLERIEKSIKKAKSELRIKSPH